MTDPTRRVIPGSFLTADALAARDARIRAEIAEDIAQAIESHHAADNLTAIQSARIARYHATQYDDLAAAAPSVPTPWSGAVTDLSVPQPGDPHARPTHPSTEETT